MGRPDRHMLRIGSLVARWTAGAGARRRAARLAWNASEPAERSWSAVAASSAMSGWLGPTASLPGPLTHEEEAGGAAAAALPRPAPHRRGPAPAGALQAAGRRVRPALAPPAG